MFNCLSMFIFIFDRPLEKNYSLNKYTWAAVVQHQVLSY